MWARPLNRLLARLIAVLAMILSFAVFAHGAHAAFPGKNGKIAFGSDDGLVHTVNPDGSGLESLGPGWEPAWSPGGTKLAIAGISTMNADGSGRTVLTTGERDGQPSWSPSGDQIVFDRQGPGPSWNLYVIGADGNGLRRLTSGFVPSWSPDGHWIAFTRGSGFNLDMFVIHPDGTAERRVTDLPGNELGADWSPDGTRFVFSACNLADCADSYANVFTIRPDGSDLRRVTDVRSFDYPPGWSPDGTRLVWGTERKPYGIWTMNADGSDQHQITGAGLYDPNWQAIPGPKRTDFKNSNRFCKAEQAFWGDQFASRYGGGSNAYGKCVSAK